MGKDPLAYNEQRKKALRNYLGNYSFAPNVRSSILEVESVAGNIREAYKRANSIEEIPSMPHFLEGLCRYVAFGILLDELCEAEYGVVVNALGLKRIVDSNKLPGRKNARRPAKLMEWGKIPERISGLTKTVVRGLTKTDGNWENMIV